MKRYFVLTLVGVFTMSALGCSSWSKKSKGALIGATSGAAVGGLIGKQKGNTAVGAILGAVIGGAAGAYIGSYMDRQAEEIAADIEGATIERVGEGIKITFDSGLMFDVNKADLRDESRRNLAELAVILNKYEDTEIVLEGHTDADGSEEYNQALSERRAKSVSGYLGTQSVRVTRFTTVGYGEMQPVAENTTASGRQDNRRVEVAIFANDKLKKVAKKETGG